MKQIVYIILILSFYGCKKFNHQEIEFPSCELCNWAENLNGTYRGQLGGVALENNNFVDSATMIVQQVFLGNSAYEDSTYMHFEVEYKEDYSATWRTGIIQIRDTSGTIYSSTGNLPWNISYLDGEKKVVPDYAYFNLTISVNGVTGLIGYLYKQ